MKWSWRIGHLAGIAIYVHGTFLILLAWLLASSLLQRSTVLDAALRLFFVTSLFCMILLHELGHAVAARRYGIRTRDITLLPIGGLARLEHLPENPWHELVIALAGPAVNMMLAATLFVMLIAMDVWPGAPDTAFVDGPFLVKLFWANVVLATFNLLPAFPMDGGRVLRALLALNVDYVRATQAAVAIGQVLALGLGLLGLFGNPMLVLIALFVWVGAATEAAMVEMKFVLRGIRIDQVMITDFRALAPTDSLRRAVHHVVNGFQEDFPVVADGRVVGVLMQSDLLVALTQRGQNVAVAEVMQREFETADAREMADGALARLQRRPRCDTMLVLRHDRLVGIVTAGNIGEFVAIQAALHGPKPRPAHVSTTAARAVPATVRP